jgi:hypothetical protein
MNALQLHPKVTASLLGGWITTLILYSLDQWAHVNPPTVVGAALVGVITFACGWLAPNTEPAPAK